MSGLTLLTDQPIRIAVECEACQGETGIVVYRESNQIVDSPYRKIDCSACGGRGFNLTKTGRQIVRVLKPYILEEEGHD